MNKLENFVKTNALIIIVLILALIAQFPTTAYFFHKIQNLIKPDFSSELNWGLAICYSLVVESSMFVWTVNGKKGLAWLYCIGTIIINLSQLLSVEIDSFFILIGGVTVSIILPMSIALFSERFNTKMEEEAEAEEETAAPLPPITPPPPPITESFFPEEDKKILIFNEEGKPSMVFKRIGGSKNEPISR